MPMTRSPLELCHLEESDVRWKELFNALRIVLNSLLEALPPLLATPLF